MSAGRIFISYRREDSAGESGRLFAELVARYGVDRVFRDVDRSIPGVPFPAAIANAVITSNVVIVVIGKRWLEELHQYAVKGGDDYVRLEIRMALERNVRVIPVLLDGTRMPAPDDLPPDIRSISVISALELSEGRWKYDTSRLVAVLDPIVNRRKRLVRTAPLIGMGLIIAIAVIGTFNLVSPVFTVGPSRIEAETVDTEQNPLAVPQVNCCGVGWSGNEQLFFAADGVGRQLKMHVTIKRAGTYDVRLGVTKAPDFGEYRIELDGVTLNNSFDAWNAGSVVTMPLLIASGKFLAAGDHIIAITIVGKNSSSTGFLAGFDYVDLIPR